MKRPSMSLHQDDYGWVSSMLNDRGHEDAFPDENASSLRRILLAFLLAGLAALLIYFARGVATGEGRRVFPALATLAALMACGAVASRGRIVLRLVCAVTAAGAFVLVVDQLAYYHWHKRVDRLMTTLRQGIEVGSTLRPTSFRIEPGREVVLQFEPPALAWTYKLDTVAPLGHTLVRGWYRLLSKVTRGRELDRVAQTIVSPHQAYAVSVTSLEAGVPACLADGGERLALSIDSWRGRRSL
jgi:hypothetical protein